VRSRFKVGGLRQCAARGQRGHLCGVVLLDHSETAELTLYSVKITMMVRIARDEAVTADAVNGFDLLDHMDREWQTGHPRLSIIFTLQVELCRRRIANMRLRAEIVL